MTTIHRSALLPYTAKQLFDLVNDINAYPQFLPWCHSTQILQHTDYKVIATISVSAKGIHKSFTTCNTLIPCQQMTMTLVKGPFKHFKARWHFQEIDNCHCIATFDIAFEFSSRIMAALLNKVFDYATQHMLEAFSKRAKALYGKQANIIKH